MPRGEMEDLLHGPMGHQPAGPLPLTIDDFRVTVLVMITWDGDHRDASGTDPCQGMHDRFRHVGRRRVMIEQISRHQD